ncbi:phage head closure protein [Paenibacillus sp. J5C_2022]|nr:phage head closure protein [Paenibacillus sp. J5C2022]
MRHRIEIYTKTKTKNELNQTTYVDSLLTTVWAEIMPQTGKMMNQQVETMLTNVSHKIICRYNQSIMDAYQPFDNKADMHIKFNGHRFDVKYMIDPYFLRKSLEIFAVEVIG